VEIWNPEKEETLTFVTNNLKLAAATIAAIYKDCWQIELFFKAIRHNLRIKTSMITTACSTPAANSIFCHREIGLI